MDMAELTALLTTEGLRLTDEIGPLTSTSDVAAVVSGLRAAGHSADLVSAAVGQARLRTRAAAKFGPFADRMLLPGPASSRPPAWRSPRTTRPASAPRA